MSPTLGRRSLRPKSVDALPRLPADDQDVLARWRSCVPMVHSIVRRHKERGDIVHPFHADELVAELEFRLLDLARTYDPGRAFPDGRPVAKFSTFAYMVLRRESSGHLTKITRGGLTGLSGKKGKHLPTRTNPAGTYRDAGADDRADGLLESLLARSPEPVGGVTREESERVIRQGMAGLSARERFVVRRVYGLGGCRVMSLAEAGRRLGVSREMARRILLAALDTLRSDPGIREME